MSLFYKRKYIIAVLIGLAMEQRFSCWSVFQPIILYPQNSHMPIHKSLHIQINLYPLPTSIPEIVEQYSDAVVYIETVVENNASSNHFLMIHF